MAEKKLETHFVILTPDQVRGIPAAHFVIPGRDPESRT